MPFQEEEITGAQHHQLLRSEGFAAQAADRIRAAENCLFSVLPHAELSRQAAEWYKACSKAMLRGDYAPLDAWVRSQSEMAAAQGFAPEDLLHLMQIFRSAAIELESWNEDIFSMVDDVMGEVFNDVRAKMKWDVAPVVESSPDVTNRPHAEAHATASNFEADESTTERRRFARNRLHFPIRIRGTGKRGQVDEITSTQSISRMGLYFVTGELYKKDQELKIVFPYWIEHGGINLEYPAKIVRLDLLGDETYGVGVELNHSRGRKSG